MCLLVGGQTAADWLTLKDSVLMFLLTSFVSVEIINRLILYGINIQLDGT